MDASFAQKCFDEHVLNEYPELNQPQNAASDPGPLYQTSSLGGDVLANNHTVTRHFTSPSFREPIDQSGYTCKDGLSIRYLKVCGGRVHRNVLVTYDPMDPLDPTLHSNSTNTWSSDCITSCSTCSCSTGKFNKRGVDAHLSSMPYNVDSNIYNSPIFSLQQSGNLQNLLNFKKWQTKLFHETDSMNAELEPSDNSKTPKPVDGDSSTLHGFSPTAPDDVTLSISRHSVNSRGSSSCTDPNCLCATRRQLSSANTSLSISSSPTLDEYSFSSMETNVSPLQSSENSMKVSDVVRSNLPALSAFTLHTLCQSVEIDEWIPQEEVQYLQYVTEEHILRVLRPSEESQNRNLHIFHNYSDQTDFVAATDRLEVEDSSLSIPNKNGLLELQSMDLSCCQNPYTPPVIPKGSTDYFELPESSSLQQLPPTCSESVLTSYTPEIAVYALFTQNSAFSAAPDDSPTANSSDDDIISSSRSRSRQEAAVANRLIDTQPRTSVPTEKVVSNSTTRPEIMTSGPSELDCVSQVSFFGFELESEQLSAMSSIPPEFTTAELFMRRSIMNDQNNQLDPLLIKVRNESSAEGSIAGRRPSFRLKMIPQGEPQGGTGVVESDMELKATTRYSPRPSIRKVSRSSVPHPIPILNRMDTRGLESVTSYEDPMAFYRNVGPFYSWATTDSTELSRALKLRGIDHSSSTEVAALDTITSYAAPSVVEKVKPSVNLMLEGDAAVAKSIQKDTTKQLALHPLPGVVRHFLKGVRFTPQIHSCILAENCNPSYAHRTPSPDPCGLICLLRKQALDRCRMKRQRLLPGRLFLFQ